MKKFIFGIGAGIIIAAFAAPPVRADYRFYVWTYQFMTMPPDETELETYVTMVQSDRSNPLTAKWKRQIEVETGLTGKWDLSMYLVDSYKPSDGKSKFEEVKLRMRYKLAPKGKFIVDPLAYAEYIIKTDRSSPDLLEAKLILAKDIDSLNVALNVISAEEYDETTQQKTWILEYAAGASYPLALNLCYAGLEIKGNTNENTLALGPVISFKGRNIWAALGAVYGLNKATSDIQSQLIFGVTF